MELTELTPSLRDIETSILALVALYCIDISVAFAGGLQPMNEKHGPAGIASGESFVVARTKLVKQGWQPTLMHTSDAYEYSGVERELVAHKFFEVDTCALDSSRCILFYSKKGTCLRVDTIGEHLNDMRVTRWVDECPNMPTGPDTATNTRP
ncbi:hypothetical protein [Pseudomonas piscis]|uniref:hypothetical protein n=1 Tax=Pseudomonas piscis TaxID=2614538 RepID=UPI001FE8DA35|nr:hypothetical protein [Pseudomonas piscis]